MKKSIVTVILLILVLSCTGKQEKKSQSEKLSTFSELISISDEFPSFDPNYPPSSPSIPTFKLSQDYPDEYEKDLYLWSKIDFRKNENEYARAVLAYSLEGNIEVEFRGQNNPIRKWYHAPWLHYDGEDCGNGREYLHGLTRERATPKFEIHRKQDVSLENWAVGMYNSPGGYTLGKVWLTDNGIPKPENANFPEGTVSFKLLFTNGSVDKVPFLENSFEWSANIYEGKPYIRENGVKKCVITERKTTTVRLLQIDIAVKDLRSPIGWVFGTFVYDASAKGQLSWERMKLVGLSWGDDPKVLTDLNRDGAFINPDLVQTALNTSLIENSSQTYDNETYIRYHGLGGRLNGPVDNPISSCVSCHGQAATYKDYFPVNQNSGRPMPMANFGLNRINFPVSEFEKYFVNASPGVVQRTFENNEYISTDYSLQIATGIRNFYQNLRAFNIDPTNKFLVRAENKEKAIDALEAEAIKNYVEALPEINRGEE